MVFDIDGIGERLHDREVQFGGLLAVVSALFEVVDLFASATGLSLHRQMHYVRKWNADEERPVPDPLRGVGDGESDRPTRTIHGRGGQQFAPPPGRREPERGQRRNESQREG